MNKHGNRGLDKADKRPRAAAPSEKQIEQKLVKAVRDAGGICPKWVSPGMDGVPDRMVLLPHGRIGFVEVKAPGESPRPLQSHRHRQLRALGFPVFVLDDAEKIPWILEEVAAWRT